MLVARMLATVRQAEDKEGAINLFMQVGTLSVNERQLRSRVNQPSQLSQLSRSEHRRHLLILYVSCGKWLMVSGICKIHRFVIAHWV